jgi:chemotaxis protein histidine kinase CheA
MSDAQFIKVPNNLRKAKVGSGRAKLDKGLLEVAEQAISDMQGDFAEWVLDDLKTMDATVVTLKSGSGDCAKARSELYRMALDLKGQAGSFGYQMVTAIAASLLDFISPREDITGFDVGVAEAHIGAIRAILAEKARDDAGETGQALLDGLSVLVAKANKISRKQAG